MVNKNLIRNISTVITDIDGVWTDGGMIYDESGKEMKKFNTRDGMGVERLFDYQIETIICTSENSEIVKKRAQKLKIDKCFVGIKKKKEFIELFILNNNMDPSSIAYIGDDLNDAEVMKIVGFTGCPSDAFGKIKSQVDYICSKKGGEGSFREFAELIIEVKNETNN
tara:strand:+ start:215 stop:715 length:501 start_codon:yes stop_codon:yes gene_type:complete